MTDSEKTIFACFAHPDDELGCIGTLLKHAEKGDRVVLSFTTSGEMASFFESMSFSEIKKTREEQGKIVGEIIDCEIKFLGYGDTSVIPSRENALEMAKVIADIKPDAIIAWGQNSTHPDHRGTTQLLYDGMTFARIPRLTSPFSPHRPSFQLPMFMYYERNSPLRTCYIDVSNQYEKIEKAFDLYSEFYGWTTSDWLYVRRRNDGMACGVKYAEKFNVLSRFSPVDQYLPLNNK